MNKVRIGLKALVAISVIAAILFAAPTIGRFVPTHKIVEPVFCVACHPEEGAELAATTHLAQFTAEVQDATDVLGEPISEAEAMSGACTMCHNYWENFKWFGVTNMNLLEVETDSPDPVTDIYGNDVSPYGLASTQTYSLRIQKTSDTNALEGVEPWKAGIDTYFYTDADGTNHTRLDYVWSLLSSKSPGPVVFEIVDEDGIGIDDGCGTAEKGLCHAAEKAVALAAMNKKLEFPDQYNEGDQNGGTGELTYTYDPDTSDSFVVGDTNGDGFATPGEGVSGQGVFFTHEMAYTTAQYAAKPVKLCGACHVFKLPPMTWGGEPWAGADIRDFSDDKNLQGSVPSTDPFGFTPTYDQSGYINFTYSGDNFNVMYRTPDWAHQMVPCMRCHVHAGINGESVSNNQ